MTGDSDTLMEKGISAPGRKSCAWYNRMGLCRWQRVARFGGEELKCPCRRFVIKKDKKGEWGCGLRHRV